MLLVLKIVWLVTSFLLSNCARTLVNARSSIFSISRKIVAGELLSFETSSRNGNVSLHVIIAGSGSRPSTEIMGGETSEEGVTDEGRRNSPGFSGVSTSGAN